MVLGAEDIFQNNLWINGSDFLWLHNAFSFFEIPDVNVHNTLEMHKKVALSTVITENVIDRFSSLDCAIRVVAYIYRFYVSCKTLSHVVTLHLSSPECVNALNVLIRSLQMFCFRSDVERLRNKLPLKNSSSLKSLVPFLDEHMILRVGRRLAQSS